MLHIFFDSAHKNTSPPYRRATKFIFLNVLSSSEVITTITSWRVDLVLQGPHHWQMVSTIAWPKGNTGIPVSSSMGTSSTRWTQPTATGVTRKTPSTTCNASMTLAWQEPSSRTDFWKFKNEFHTPAKSTKVQVYTRSRLKKRSTGWRREQRRKQRRSGFVTLSFFLVFCNTSKLLM